MYSYLVMNEDKIYERFRKLSGKQRQIAANNIGEWQKIGESHRNFGKAILDYAYPHSHERRDTNALPLPAHHLVSSLYQDIAEGAPVTNRVRRLVGKVLLPSLGIHLPEATLQTETAKTNYRYCSAAEIGFIDCLDQINDTEDLGQSRTSVYFYDEAPILFRKSHDEPTALMLEDASIDGLYVPQGTIVGVGPAMNTQPIGKKDFIGNCGVWSLEAYDVEEIHITPGRLSPWAHKHSSGLKPLFGVNDPRKKVVNPHRSGLVDSLRLSDFKKSSQKLRKKLTI